MEYFVCVGVIGEHCLWEPVMQVYSNHIGFAFLQLVLFISLSG